METLMIVFRVGLSYLIKAIGSIIMIGVIFFGYCLLDGVSQGVFILTPIEGIKLIVSAIFLFWLSLRLMMLGDELLKSIK